MRHSGADGINDLVQSGILRIASQPRMNPQHLDFRRYTIPLIEHDYPARTPAMWNSAYQMFGLDIGNIVLTGDANSAPFIFETLRRDPRYMGGGAGVGFKEKAVDLVDVLDPVAAAAGAINFVTKSAGTMCGHNTDGIGFATALTAMLPDTGKSLHGKTVLMLGAGGTARSVAFALAARGARLCIINRTVSRAAALADRLNAEFAADVAWSASEEQVSVTAPVADIIVNVSTKGAAGPLAEYSALAPAYLPATNNSVQLNLNESSAILGRIPHTTILCDVVIVDGETPFLRQARERGFRVLDGIAMVVNQAVEAFWILHGSDLQQMGLSKDDVTAVMRSAAITEDR